MTAVGRITQAMLMAADRSARLDPPKAFAEFESLLRRLGATSVRRADDPFHRWIEYRVDFPGETAPEEVRTLGLSALPHVGEEA